MAGLIRLGCIVLFSLVAWQWESSPNLHVWLAEEPMQPLPPTRHPPQMILRSLAFCHARWVVHRDVKPNNFVAPAGGECGWVGGWVGRRVGAGCWEVWL